MIPEFEAGFHAALDEVLPSRERLPGADYEAPGADDRQKSTSEPALPFIDIAAWHGSRAPEREWAVRDRVPLKNVTLLSGEGGVGKSILALHVAAATTLGRDWLGSMPMPGPALVLCCEDDEHELRRRLDQIVEHYGASHEELSKNLHALSLAGHDAVMAAPNKHGLIMRTPLFARLRQAARDIRPRLIVIDNSADVFAGNENDRAQVRQFITLLRGIAIDANAGLLLTSHPSLTGISTGSGLSGSTAWNASVRSRLYFRRAKTEKDEEPDPDLRVLELMKSNYGPVGETITLRWKAGLFLPVAGTGSLDKMAAEQRADHLFLTLLDRFNNQGRNSSDKPNAPTYAPTMFAKEKESREQASEGPTSKEQCAGCSRPTKFGSNHTAHRPRPPPD
jgi:RecA-family ATPase